MYNKVFISVLENKKIPFDLLKTFVDKSKDETQKLAIEHRELHSTVSKVGKAIDRVCMDLNCILL